MEKSFNVILSNNSLDDYESMLSGFEVWKNLRRDIKLNSLMNGVTSSEFTIDMKSNNQLYLIVIEETSPVDVTISLNKVCASINNIKFFINKDKIEKLEVDCKILNTPDGKLVKNLIDSGVDLVLKQKFTSYLSFAKFYLTYPSKSDLKIISILD
jgi:hypothetical protein